MCHNNISAKGDVCSNEQSQANAHILHFHTIAYAYLIQVLDGLHYKETS